MSDQDIADSGAPVAEELKRFVERIERFEEEKKALADDIKDAFCELLQVRVGDAMSANAPGAAATAIAALERILGIIGRPGISAETQLYCITAFATDALAELS